jgi:hypothetical protein
MPNNKTHSERASGRTNFLNYRHPIKIEKSQSGITFVLKDILESWFITQLCSSQIKVCIGGIFAV